MKKLLKLAIASMMIIGAISVSAQDDKAKTAGQKYIEVSARNFESASLVQPDGSVDMSRWLLERNIIRQGDSTRFKYLFKPDDEIIKIEIKGVKSATRKEIRKGEFIATLRPEKSTTYEMIETRLGSTTGMKHKIVVMVVEPEKYDSIIELRSRLRGQRQHQQVDILYRELMGEKVDSLEKAMVDKMVK